PRAGRGDAPLGRPLPLERADRDAPERPPRLVARGVEQRGERSAPRLPRGAADARGAPRAERVDGAPQPRGLRRLLAARARGPLRARRARSPAREEEPPRA